MKTSVLTIVRGRQTHLQNQLKGLLQSQPLTDEWIVVGMDRDVNLANTSSIPIRTGRVDGDGSALSLAAARNCAAAMCQTEGMIFLDVDCIASPTMVSKFNIALSYEPHLWMGAAKYLPAGATDGNCTMNELSSSAVKHPLQPKLATGNRHASTKYEMFWSLCFAATQSTFNAIGGFDETFDGYGGEDTDFAFAARDAGIPFGFVDATAYHQHHRVCKPPLNHFAAIVRNAIRFRSEWEIWPMESWLKRFAKMNLIAFDVNQDEIIVLREPSAEEINDAITMTPAGY